MADDLSIHGARVGDVGQGKTNIALGNLISMIKACQCHQDVANIVDIIGKALKNAQLRPIEMSQLHIIAEERLNQPNVYDSMSPEAQRSLGVLCRMFREYHEKHDWNIDPHFGIELPGGGKDIDPNFGIKDPWGGEDKDPGMKMHLPWKPIVIPWADNKPSEE